MWDSKYAHGVFVTLPLVRDDNFLCCWMLVVVSVLR